jgi:hypothetical protein
MRAGADQGGGGWARSPFLVNLYPHRVLGDARPVDHALVVSRRRVLAMQIIDHPAVRRCFMAVPPSIARLDAETQIIGSQ